VADALYMMTKLKGESVLITWLLSKSHMLVIISNTEADLLVIGN
jgi:hypothetical protein